MGGEGGDFGAREGPGHLAFWLGRFAPAGNDKQVTAGTEKRGNVLDCLWAERGWEYLEGVGFENKIEIATPLLRRIEKIGGVIVDGGIGKAFSGSANGRFRNVEGSGAKTPSGKLLGVIAEAATDDQRGFSGCLLRMRDPETNEMRSGVVVRPRNSALPFFTFAVENFEPACRVTFAVEFGGEFARSCTVFHN